VRALKKIKIQIPKSAEFIIEQLENNGFEGYLVGGCVRDSILKRQINDWDITTNAKPSDIVNLFEHTVLTGIKHGTVTVIIDKDAFEVTTYRIDGEYIDNRHPEDVTFVSDIRLDLSRRDFTINAMAYNDKNGLLDYFGGLDDLNKKIVRAVGEPLKRFDEDALRMLRAVRFAAQLNFNIDSKTNQAIKSLSKNISYVSIERIRDEFNKIILSNASYINNLIELRLLKEFLIELEQCKGIEQNNKYHIFDVLNHMIVATNNIKKDLHLRLAMLFHDISKANCQVKDKNGAIYFNNHEEIASNMTIDILKRMKYDNATIKKVSTLIKYHGAELNSSVAIRRMLSLIGIELFNDLLLVKEADISAQNPSIQKNSFQELELIKQNFNNIILNNDCFSIKDLAVNGSDLTGIGVIQGREIGRLLNYLLDIVINDPSKNQKDILLKSVRVFIEK
jgi:tRNA nucleotidyltransferase (CCA-adding enzyme)